MTDQATVLLIGSQLNQSVRSTHAPFGGNGRASRSGQHLARPHQFVRSIENSTASSSACFIGAAGNSASASFAMAP